jgi:hypothetical protein
MTRRPCAIAAVLLVQCASAPPDSHVSGTLSPILAEHPVPRRHASLASQPAMLATGAVSRAWSSERGCIEIAPGVGGEGTCVAPHHGLDTVRSISAPMQTSDGIWLVVLSDGRSHGRGAVVAVTPQRHASVLWRGTVHYEATLLLDDSDLWIVDGSRIKRLSSAGHELVSYTRDHPLIAQCWASGNFFELTARGVTRYNRQGKAMVAPARFWERFRQISCWGDGAFAVHSSLPFGRDVLRVYREGRPAIDLTPPSEELWELRSTSVAPILHVSGTSRLLALHDDRFFEIQVPDTGWHLPQGPEISLHQLFDNLSPHLCLKTGDSFLTGPLEFPE